MLIKSTSWGKGFISFHRLYSSSLREVKVETPGRKLETVTEAETMKKHFTASMLFMAWCLHFYTTQCHLPRDGTVHSCAPINQLVTNEMVQRSVTIQSCRSQISVQGPSSQVTLASSHTMNRKQSQILWLSLYNIQPGQICGENK